ncbi:hypothetical protein EDB81DRAFT_946222 [Dactylonectria macrodidyma]|uniref:protein S-acyltransferase n=1 Tax=Dactylonectria macrodidyma TaxID=307937 RepID=A0A9P9F471_9HYPO|nr:hypothetical protein EDB81DRAFT_946222 [Dactylonectria macrodidyma]
MSQDKPTGDKGDHLQSQPPDDDDEPIAPKNNEIQEEQSKRGQSDEGNAEDLLNLILESENDDADSEEFHTELNKWKHLLNTPCSAFSGKTPLHAAAERGFLKMAEQLLRAGAEINVVDDEGAQPLQLACMSGNDGLVKLFLEEKDYTPQPDNDGWYPIHWASVWGFQAETARLLLGGQNHKHINEKETIAGRTPLALAVHHASEQVMDILLENGAKLDIQDSDGWTALITATRNPNPDILSKLIKHMELEGKKVEIPNGQEEALMELFDISPESPGSSRKFTKLDSSVDIPDDEGKTALHHIMRSVADSHDLPAAIKNAAVRILYSVAEKTLLLRDKKGNTAFDVAFGADDLVDGMSPFLQAMVDRLKNKNDKNGILCWLAEKTERHSFAETLLSKMSASEDEENSLQISEWGLGELAIYNQLPEVLLNYVSAVHPNEPECDHCNFDDVKERGRKIINKLKDDDKSKGQKSSRATHLGGGTKKKKEDQVAPSGGKNESERMQVLQDMEDILDFFFVETTQKPKESREPSKPTPLMERSLEKFYAAVVQIRQGENELSKYTKFRTVQDVVYGNVRLDTVGETIKRFEKLRSQLNDAKESTSQGAADPGKEFTWIHLPSTNANCLDESKNAWLKLLLLITFGLSREDYTLTYDLGQDIMKRILKQENCPEDEFHDLESFFRASWVEIPDRTSASRFMRPRYGKRSPEGTPSQDPVKETKDEIPKTKKDDGEDCKPREETSGCTKEGKRDRFSGSALYMPFLSFSDYHFGPASTATQPGKPVEPQAVEEIKQREELFTAYKDSVIHGSPTLDEYYYHFGEDDESRKEQCTRNKTQVATKFLQQPDAKESEFCRLLRVNQLWAWTVGDEWLITSSSCACSDIKSKFVMNILKHLHRRTEDGNHWRGPASPADLIEVIVEYCIGSYARKHKFDSQVHKATTNQTTPPNPRSKPETNQGEPGGDKTQVSEADGRKEVERSIRQIFSDSINIIGRREAKIFGVSCDQDDLPVKEDASIKTNEAKPRKARSQEGLKGATRPPATNKSGGGDVSLQTQDGSEASREELLMIEKLQKATKDASQLLSDIKDVRDELNILKTIAASQRKVQSSMAGKGVNATSDNLDENSTAKYVLDDIQELEKAAGRIQDALHTTITIHESQIANLQAKESVKQGGETADQGRTIMLFTLVTVYFLPLSFLTSLFALDVHAFLEAPAWSFVVIFIVPLPFVGVAVAYVYSETFRDFLSKHSRERDTGGSY